MKKGIDTVDSVIKKIIAFNSIKRIRKVDVYEHMYQLAVGKVKGINGINRTAIPNAKLKLSEHNFCLLRQDHSHIMHDSKKDLMSKYINLEELVLMNGIKNLFNGNAQASCRFIVAPLIF